MDHAFWHSRWESSTPSFHEGRPNRLLVAHLAALGLAPGARVFVPLCGKSRDIGWLIDQGVRVAGAELSDIAVRDLFSDLGVQPEIAAAGPLRRHSAEGIDIFLGDIFDLDAATLGPVDAVYDRAALVALPDEMRARYARHLPALTAGAPQLLITFDYDQSKMEGPPFSVPEAMVRALYGETFAIQALAGAPVEGMLKGLVPATERIWRLTRSGPRFSAFRSD